MLGVWAAAFVRPLPQPGNDPATPELKEVFHKEEASDPSGTSV